MTPPYRFQAEERTRAAPATWPGDRQSLAGGGAGVPPFAQSGADASSLMSPAPASSTADTFADPMSLLAPAIGVADDAAARYAADMCPVLHFETERPWLVRVAAGTDPVAVSRELYGGVDLSELMSSEFVPPSWWSSDEAGQHRYAVFPEALASPYREQFHSAMQALVDRDVAAMESIINERRIDGDDERALVNYVRFWAEAKDLRRLDGRSYLDALLGRLSQDRASTDYVVWSGDSQSYLDWLFEEVEEKSGELLGIIAQNSFEFGGYRPDWAGLDATGVPLPGGAPRSGSQDIANRGSQIVRDLLEGYTNRDESRTIVDALSGLPPREQGLALQEMMGHYDDRNWIGLGKYGEAWETGMLYWLFEDLMAGDRARLVEAMKKSGVMDAGTIDALAAGRGWGGKYLPWTTRKGQEATEYWADVANNSEGPKKWGASVAGSFSALWLPETAGATVLTLATANAMNPQGGLLPTLGQAFPRAGAVVSVLGTGLGAYQIGISAQRALFDKDPYTGQQLQDGERLASVLNVISGTILLGIGFAGTSPRVRVNEVFAPRPALPAGGAAPEVKAAWRVTSHDPKTGDVTVVGVHMETGQRVIVQMNVRTGNGVATNTVTGETFTIAGGQLQDFPLLAAPGATGTASAPGGAVSTQETALALSQAIGTPTALAPVAPFSMGSTAGLTLAPGGLQPGVWQALPPSPVTVVPAPVANGPLQLGSGPYAEDTLGYYLSDASLDALEATYGTAVRTATANARTRADLRAIGNGLGSGLKQQYNGDVGEYLRRDLAPFLGRYAAGSHGRSFEHGPDVLEVTLAGDPAIFVNEAKLGASRHPYRQGAGSMPNAYRQPFELYEYIHGVIRDPQVPRIVRIRLKAALDQGRIQWTLNAYGNVRVKISGNDVFPGDVDVVTPIVIPP